VRLLAATDEAALKKAHDDLWAGDLDCVSVAPDVQQGGRNLELFLDRLLASASTGAEHLLDPAFAGALDESETALTAALRDFEANLPAAARAAPAWNVVEDALRRMGMPYGSANA